MEFIFFLLACFLFVTAVVMPWVNYSQTLRLKNEIKRLKDLSANASRIDKPSDCETRKVSETVEEPVVSGFKSNVEIRSLIDERPEVPERDSEGQNVAVKTAFRDVQPLLAGEASVSPEDTSRAEQDWFGKLAVWVGGVALLMAGFFMVKYSIESGWMTPKVRLWTTDLSISAFCGSPVSLYKTWVVEFIVYLFAYRLLLVR